MKKKMILSFIIALLSLMTVRASDKTYQISPMGGTCGELFVHHDIWISRTDILVGSTSDTQWLSADIIRNGPDGYSHLSPDGYSHLRILVDSNFTGTRRAARVQLDGYYGRQVYFITQEAISPTLEGVNTSFWMDGGSIVLRAGHSNGVKWRLVSSVPWITITGDSSGEGNEIETNFTVMPSDDGKERTGSITLQGFKSLNDSWVSLKSISIRQDGWLSYAGEKISVSSPVTIKYPKGDLSEFWVDGKSVVVSSDGGSYVWQPLTKGDHDVKCIYGSSEWSSTLTVSALQTFEDSVPNPPMAKDNNISIYPLTDHFDVGGGGLAISTSGSGTWTAVASEPWITLNSTSGTAGKPLAFRVSANTNVEERTAYIYVSGHVYTATQTGIGATVDKSNETFEYNGGFGTVNVTAQNRVVWQARPNVDWISVSPTSVSGEGSIEYYVAPFDEVSTRQGTMTVAGNTVTVFQYGRRMKLATYEEKRDWYTHVIPITVDALAITEWSVTPNASWISVVDGGNGEGGDLVSIAISENSSYKERVGTVTIGTEIFTVTQDGRTELEISIDPVESEASVNGANAFLSVYATPDLPWTVTSDSSWVTIYDKFKNGEGNGNIVYIVTPNSTLYDRTAIVSVIPEKASGMPTRKHTVRQPAAESAISLNGYEFEVAGESCSVEVSVADIVEWKIDENLDWITINGSTSRMGSGTVVIQAAANDTVYPRSGTITIARKTFTVTQKARGVEVEYDEKLFNARGGSSSVSIHPDGNVAWTVEVSDDWIIVWGDESGTGDAEIEYMVAAWNDEGSSRIGWIKIGDKKIYITQRAYDLSISPNGKKVTGNNGAGEIGVSASIGDVWNAIVTEPWITIVDGYDSGTGSGTVRFIYTENNTGKTRTGKIIIAGEVYTLEQAARMMVNITATAGRGGKVSGGGSYDLGSEVTLTAIPDDGYKFSYWTGDVSTMQNPITVTVDVAKSYTAVFEPLPIAFDSVTSGTDGVRLSWNNLAWATTYRIYRGVTSVPSSATQLAEIVNTGNCTYLDESGVIETTYWYWIEAEGAEDSVMSDPMTGMKQKPIVISSITYQNLRGATHTNPESYQEGTLVSFANPSGVTGYTFAGWTPSQITADMTGAQTVRASWTANSYTISYNANGGSGTMDGTSATYDSEVVLSGNKFTYGNSRFKGWAIEPNGDVVYLDNDKVVNLTADIDGVVTLYAVWGETFKIVDGVLLSVDIGEETSVIIPEGVVSIGGRAFAGCAALESVTIPVGVRNIGEYAFADCRSLGSITIPEGVLYIGDYAFSNCSALKTVTLPGSITHGNDWTWFEGCEMIGSATLPFFDDSHDYRIESVTNVTIAEGTSIIPCWAFLNYRKLKNVTISDTVTTIVNEAFMFCSSLESVTIPKNVSNIVGNPFRYCTSLIEIIADDDNKHYKSEDGLLLSKDGTRLVIWPSGRSDGYIPIGVTSIGYSSFSASLVTSITIPITVTNIGEYAFSDCDKLSYAKVPLALKQQVEANNVFDCCSDSLQIEFYEEPTLVSPVITPGDGSIFKTDTCTVTITCTTPDAKIYYSTNGRTPSVNDRYLYQGPFTISDTTTVIAFSVKNGKASDYVESKITYVEPEPLTLKGVLDEANLVSVETGGAAEWLPIYEEGAKVGDSLAISGAVEEGDEEEQQSLLKVKVEGKGTMSFWWRVDCEPDPGKRFTWDRGVLTIDGKDIDKKDGITEWMNHSVTFDTAGEHEIVLTYISDGYLPVDDVYAGCMWADGFVWTPKEEFPALDASATKEMISQVLSGATDAKLSVNIKTVAEYSAFRSWVKGLLGTSQDQVKSSPNAWLSYVLDAGSLIEGAVSDERVKIEELAVGGESGIFDMKLRIDDVSIGAGATVANLLRVFAVEGTASLADEDFSVEKVAVSFVEPDNGAISLAVTPRQTGNAFFVRTRLRDQLNGDKMNGCEVSFNLNGGGSLPEGMSAKKFVEYASAYGELPVPTREGYVFDGWYTAASGGEKVTSATEMTIFATQTLYARWTIKSYTVVFDANGGSGGVSKSYTHGATLGELPTPTRDGYKFLGWFTAAEGGNAVTAKTVVPADMTIYARWEFFDEHDKVQLWEGGPYWATTNIGAEKPEDYGYYFWWGDTVGYKRENDKWVASDGSNSDFSFEEDNAPTCRKDISTLQSERWITSDGVLAPKHDAATVHWGGNWRMPTEAELNALSTNCDWTWTTLNGVNGYVVKGRGAYASKSIFLPAAGVGYGASFYDSGSYGYYWSSVPYSDRDSAWDLSFNSSNHFNDDNYRNGGQSVRPVLGFTK